MEIPAINLKAIVTLHWLLTMWGCIGLPSSYAWGNFAVLALGVWAIAQRDSIDAVVMFLAGMVLTVLTDIIHFGIYYPSSNLRDVHGFSAATAILSLLFKPISCFFVYQMYRERGGEYNVNFEKEIRLQVSLEELNSLFLGFSSLSRNRDTYESIEHQGGSGSQANPFNQAQDTKPGGHAY